MLTRARYAHEFREAVDRQSAPVCARGLSWYTSLLLLIAGLLAGPAALAAADMEAQVRDIALQLRCPVCQGLSVGDSPSELAHEMREVVREQLRQGKSRAEVLDYFVQRYGEWILLAPPQRGFNLVVWVLPFLLLPVGGLAVYLGTRRWVRNRQVSALPPTADATYTERLQRELDSYT